MKARQCRQVPPLRSSTQRPSSKYDTTPQEFLSITALSDLYHGQPSSRSDMETRDEDEERVDEEDEVDEDENENDIHLERQRTHEIWKDRRYLFSYDEKGNSSHQDDHRNESRPLQSSCSSSSYATSSEEEEEESPLSVQRSLSSTVSSREGFMSDSTDESDDDGYIGIKKEFQRMGRALKEELQFFISSSSMSSGDYYAGSIKHEMSNLSLTQELLRQELTRINETLNFVLSMEDDDSHEHSQEDSSNVDDEDDESDDDETDNDDDDSDVNTDRRSSFTVATHESRSEDSRKGHNTNSPRDECPLCEEEYEVQLTKEMIVLSHTQEMLQQGLAMIDDSWNDPPVCNDHRSFFTVPSRELRNEDRRQGSTEPTEEDDEVQLRKEMIVLSHTQDMLQRGLAIVDDLWNDPPVCNDHISSFSVSCQELSNEDLPPLGRSTGESQLSVEPSEVNEVQRTNETIVLSRTQELLEQELALVHDLWNEPVFSDYDENDENGDIDHGSTYLAIQEEFNKVNAALNDEMEQVRSSSMTTTSNTTTTRISSEDCDDSSLCEEMAALSHTQGILGIELSKVREEEVLSSFLKQSSSWTIEIDDVHHDEQREPSTTAATTTTVSVPVLDELDHELVPRSGVGTEVREEPPTVTTGLVVHRKRIQSPQTVLGDDELSTANGCTIQIATHPLDSTQQDYGYKSPMSESSQQSLTYTPSSIATPSASDWWDGILGAVDKWFVAKNEPEPKPEVEEEDNNSSCSKGSHALSTISEGNETKRSKQSQDEIKSTPSQPNEFIEILQDLRIEVNTGVTAEKCLVIDTGPEDETTLHRVPTFYYDALQSFASLPTVDSIPQSITPQSRIIERTESRSPTKRSSRLSSSLFPSRISDATNSPPTRIPDAANSPSRTRSRNQEQYIQMQSSKKGVQQIASADMDSQSSPRKLYMNYKTELPTSLTQETEPDVEMIGTGMPIVQGKDRCSARSLECFKIHQQLSKIAHSFDVDELSDSLNHTVKSQRCSPRSPCSRPSKETIMRMSHKQCIDKTLCYELQMAESVDLLAESIADTVSKNLLWKDQSDAGAIEILETEVDTYEQQLPITLAGGINLLSESILDAVSTVIQSTNDREARVEPCESHPEANQQQEDMWTDRIDLPSASIPVAFSTDPLSKDQPEATIKTTETQMNGCHQLEDTTAESIDPLSDITDTFSTEAAHSRDQLEETTNPRETRPEDYQLLLESTLAENVDLLSESFPVTDSTYPQSRYKLEAAAMQPLEPHWDPHQHVVEGILTECMDHPSDSFSILSSLNRLLSADQSEGTTIAPIETQLDTHEQPESAATASLDHSSEFIPVKFSTDLLSKDHPETMIETHETQLDANDGLVEDTVVESIDLKSESIPVVLFSADLLSKEQSGATIEHREAPVAELIELQSESIPVAFSMDPVTEDHSEATIKPPEPTTKQTSKNPENPLELQHSNHSNTELSKFTIQISGPTVSISPLTSFRSRSLDDSTTSLAFEKLPEVKSPVERLLRQTSSQGPLSCNFGLRSQPFNSESVSSRHRKSVDLIMQEVKSSKSGSLIALGTFSFGNNDGVAISSDSHQDVDDNLEQGGIRVENNDPDSLPEVDNNLEQEDNRMENDDIDESMTQTLTRIYLRSQVGIDDTQYLALKETTSHTDDEVQDDDSVSGVISRIARRVARGASRYPADEDPQNRADSIFLHPASARISDKVTTPLKDSPERSTSGSPNELRRIFNDIMDRVGTCGNSLLNDTMLKRGTCSTSLLNETSLKVDKFLHRGTSKTQPLPSGNEPSQEYPISTRTTRLDDSGDNIDICVTCINDKPPMQPIREEFAAIGVELVLHDDIDELSLKQCLSSLGFEEVEPIVERQLKKQTKGLNQEKRIFRRCVAVTPASCTLPLSPANSCRHKFYVPSAHDEPRYTPLLSPANSRRHQFYDPESLSLLGAVDLPLVGKEVNLSRSYVVSPSDSADQEKIVTDPFIQIIHSRSSKEFRSDPSNAEHDDLIEGMDQWAPLPPSITRDSSSQKSKPFFSQEVKEQPKQTPSFRDDTKVLMESMGCNEEPTVKEPRVLTTTEEENERHSGNKPIDELLKCNERLLQSMVDADYSGYCALTSPVLTGFQVGTRGCHELGEENPLQEELFWNQTGHDRFQMMNPAVRFMSNDNVALVTYTRIDRMVDGRVVRRWDETRIWERRQEVRRRFVSNGEGGHETIEVPSKSLWINCHFHQSLQVM